MITPPVTSKYEIAYWIKLIGTFVIIIVGLVVIICVGGNNDSTDRTQNILTTSGFFVAFIVSFSAALGTNFPKKIFIDVEHIIIDYYLTHKHIVINFSDINKVS